MTEELTLRVGSTLFMGIGAGMLLSNKMASWEFPRWIQGIAIVSFFIIGMFLYYKAEKMRG